MKTEKYLYTESGLDNIVINGIETVVDNKGNNTVLIKNIFGLHMAITLALINKPTNLSGKELRFLRSELGLTQAQLGQHVQREALTISRWERGEISVEPASAALIRLLVHDELKLETSLSVKDAMRWSVPSANDPRLEVEMSKTNDYSFQWKMAA